MPSVLCYLAYCMAPDLLHLKILSIGTYLRKSYLQPKTKLAQNGRKGERL